MRPFVALSFVLASAIAAPQYAHGIAHAVAPVEATVSHGVAPNTVGATTHSVGPAPAGAHHYSAGAVVPHPVNYVAPPAPAPFTTATQAAGVTTVHQPAPVVTKQVHLGQTNYVSGYATKIHKPATPHLPIAVPTVLKGTQTVNAPIVKTQTEIHNVQSPVFVERKVDAPYDAPFYTQKIVEVPTPVHVDAPYNVHVPVAVQGEPIIKKTVAAPVVTHSHHVNAAPAAVGYAGHLAAAPAAAAVY